MRKITAVAIAIAMLALAGCGGTTQTSIKDQVSAVIVAVKDKCGFVVTVASATAMLTASNPVAVGVAAVTDAVCKAVTSIPAQSLLGWGKDKTPPKECPKVNGVCVEGEFVDPKKERQGALETDPGYDVAEMSGGGTGASTPPLAVLSGGTQEDAIKFVTATKVIHVTVCPDIPGQPCTDYPGK